MIRIRPMTFDDLELGLRLRQQTGWNQTVADWARFLRLQPDGCFVAEQDSVACGTVTTCVFGDIAWVGMMLVEESRRGQGIGRALMAQALAFLDRVGVRSIRLDATERGEPLYRSLGFVEQFPIGRFSGRPIRGDRELLVEPGERQLWEAVYRLDAVVTGTDRRRLLFALFHERPEEMHVVRRGGAVIGYLTTRRGMQARQIGPCIATAEAGPPLLSDALTRFADRDVFVDIPLPHRTATALVMQRGLQLRRTLLRMTRGDQLTERVQQLWASSGPEKG